MEYLTTWDLKFTQSDLPRSNFNNGALASASEVLKILVIATGGLGDAIHLLPSLKLIRHNFPTVKLHVAMGHKDFFGKLAPWIDMVWPSPHPYLLRNLVFAQRLRRQRFDAVFVLSWGGSSVFTGWCSGAPLRIGRRGPPDKHWWWQRLAFTHTVHYPLQTKPMYFQRWACLREAGLSGSRPEFQFQILPDWFTECGLAETDRKSYIHVSPFTSAQRRDLPIDQCVELVERLHQVHDRIILSCDRSASACARLQLILSQLTFRPWKIYRGTLEIHHLVALIQGAKLHFGGDTGGLHVARLVGTPSVSWFRTAFGNVHWAPAPEEILHRAIISSDNREDALHGIDTGSILAQARQVAQNAPVPVEIFS